MVHFLKVKRMNQREIWIFFFLKTVRSGTHVNGKAGSKLNMVHCSIDLSCASTSVRQLLSESSHIKFWVRWLLRYCKPHLRLTCLITKACGPSTGWRRFSYHSLGLPHTHAQPCSFWCLLFLHHFLHKLFFASTDLTIVPSNHAQVHLEWIPAKFRMVQAS